MLNVASNALSITKNVLDITKDNNEQKQIVVIPQQLRKIVVLPYSKAAIDVYQVRATGYWKNGHGHRGVRAYLYDGNCIDFGSLSESWQRESDHDFLVKELHKLNKVENTQSNFDDSEIKNSALWEALAEWNLK